jgi:hypothetical protein
MSSSSDFEIEDDDDYSQIQTDLYVKDKTMDIKFQKIATLECRLDPDLIYHQLICFSHLS